jgi:ATP-dependent RNA helicase SUPV3L1/SUV3
MGSDLEYRIRNVTAVLGPTNTGKTHLAIERMLGHDSGMIGLPLRLLAREVYDKIVARVGAEKVALVTGEEKIKPERARYWVATVEAMPREIDVDFLAIDEVQLAADPERGHVFTDRLLHARGRSETLLLGAQTMSGAISDLIPGANFISRPRLSKLSYAGEKKITRLPQRTAVIAFSASEVYAIAELIRRQRGGTAVVLGALSPRTRNAQVALYQSGDVDFLVATDAIGMGLNLDVDHIAFSSVRKFDGQNFRNLTPSELAQIAGRAGRHMNDGTFGVTGACEAFDPDIVERIETHAFDPVRVLQWRNRELDFRSLGRLRESLKALPSEQRLTRARMADDVSAFETVSDDDEVARLATSPAAVMRLWEVCQIPDYRKISSQNHAELVATLYKDLMGPTGRIGEDWFARQVALADRTDGDIDTLANRLAHIRTWTFVSNRSDWLKDPAHWQGRTRAIEDALSDALHECLTQRFVDRRTSALMKGMRDKEELSAEIKDDGSINVEQHYVGRLRGFRFTPDAQAEGVHGKAARSAAAQVLAGELGMRARRVAAAQADAFKIDRKGQILWRGEEIARLEAAEDPLRPSVVLLVDEHLSGPDRDKIQTRLETWLAETVAEKLKPLVDLSKAEDVTGLARGIAFQMKENFGVLKREAIAEELKSLDQTARAQLRRYGVRFGAFNIYFPQLLKPAPADLILSLWSLKHAAAAGLDVDKLPEPPRAGLTSSPVAPELPEAFYRAYGYHVCGPRAIRFDMLERLADMIRPLLAWRAVQDPEARPPTGSTGDGGFTTTPEMMSILGCSPDELGKVLKALGFRLDRRPVKTATAKPAAPQSAAASVEPSPAATPDIQEQVPPPETASTESGEASMSAPDTVDVAPAEAPAVAAAEAPAEIQYEDVWRPRRHHRGEASEHGQGRSEHRRRDRRHGQRPGGADRTATAQAGMGNAGASAGNGSGPGTGTDAAAGAPVEAHGQAQEQRRDRDRHRHRDERGNRDRQGPGAQTRDRSDKDRPGAGQRGEGHRSEGSRSEGRRDQGGRGDRGDRRRNEDRGQPRAISAAPPRKAGADADSPFASLLALRSQLEQARRDKGS